MQADTYMNGAFQTTSAAEDLARIPYRESEGEFNRSELRRRELVRVTVSPL